MITKFLRYYKRYVSSALDLFYCFSLLSSLLLTIRLMTGVRCKPGVSSGYPQTCTQGSLRKELEDCSTLLPRSS